MQKSTDLLVLRSDIAEKIGFLAGRLGFLRRLLGFWRIGGGDDASSPDLRIREEEAY